MRVVDASEVPHVLMRHFAADALIACIDAGELSVLAKKAAALRTVDDSSLPRLHKKLKKFGEDFYQGRPKSAPKPKAKFSLEYDFRKQDVHYLSYVFGQHHWRVEDLIAESVRDIDASAETMHDTGGRQGQRQLRRGTSSAYHGYGEQLGWHGMLIAAGRLLETEPVTDDWWYDEPWQVWLERYLLTRKDGYWLADARDSAPLEISTILMEVGEDGLELTGDKKKVLDLVGL